MLKFLKKEANRTYTENGAITPATTQSDCLDLFATIGALRGADAREISRRFARAWAEDPSLALKIAFYARDVRGGLGERQTFRVILLWLAHNAPESLMRNLHQIAEYGRFDDLLMLMDTPCEKAMLKEISSQLHQDMQVLESGGENISLLGKWLPSVNASSKATVLRARKLCRMLGLREQQYRKLLTRLRAQIAILENNLRCKDYTFDYAKQPSRAMFKYRKAFLRNDQQRYLKFMGRVSQGKATLHTGTLYPYDVIASCLTAIPSKNERAAINTTWNALPNFASDENALVVVDGSGSMYWNPNYHTKVTPAAVAQSLGIYFAQRNTGAFKNHFITFSMRPRLIEIKGKDICDQLRYCMSYNEAANTDLQAVFQLLLRTATQNNLKQSDMPDTLYIISDMEFDGCAKNSSLSNFEQAKQEFAAHGYRLPKIVFWNVASRNQQQPVTQNEQGVVLVSGCTPRIFSMVMDGCLSPYQYMCMVLGTERYAGIAA